MSGDEPWCAPEDHVERVRLTFEWDSQSHEQDEALCDEIVDLAWPWLDGYNPAAEGFTPKGKTHSLPPDDAS